MISFMASVSTFFLGETDLPTGVSLLAPTRAPPLSPYLLDLRPTMFYESSLKEAEALKGSGIDSR